MYNYSILDETAGLISTGQAESNLDGEFTVIGQELSAAQLYFEISSMPEFVFVSTSNFVVNLTSQIVEQNNTETNQTGNQTETGNNTVDPIDNNPTTISDVTLDGCDSINQVVGAEQMGQLVCTITNPNSFAVDVEISFVSSLNLPVLLLFKSICSSRWKKVVYWELDLV